MEKDVPTNSKDITIRVIEEGEDGFRVTVDTEEKDSTVISTNIMLALCALYQIPENYLPELFEAFTRVLMEAHSEKQKERTFSLRDLFR